MKRASVLAAAAGFAFTATCLGIGLWRWMRVEVVRGTERFLTVNINGDVDGADVVKAIQEYERRNGNHWRSW